MVLVALSTGIQRLLCECCKLINQHSLNSSSNLGGKKAYPEIPLATVHCVPVRNHESSTYPITSQDITSKINQIDIGHDGGIGGGRDPLHRRPIGIWPWIRRGLLYR